ncbi:hypothetical protein [Streptomyces odonnellii]|uniref:hypothetical protein n=1 Tax=Streptomyces odonnellii TaxID=1417980 RepID=UPI000625197B|nr:hypothetical protein [Streptomyces odonnellii]
MKLPRIWLQHEITIEPYEGSGAYGDVYGVPVEVRGFLEQTTRLVRDAGGDEVVSSSTFYCRHGAVNAPTKSRVALPDGTKTTVIVTHDGTAGRLPLPEHLEVILQ